MTSYKFALNEQITIDNAPINLTYAGMASWGGMGPEGKTCRECKFYRSYTGSYDWYAGSNKIKANQLKPCRCFKRREFGYEPGDTFPHSAPACKYFDQSDNPPPARKV